MKIKEVKYERRLTSTDNEQLSTRALTDEKTGKRFIEGYGSVFGQESRVIYERGKVFKEIIQRNAFDKILSEKPNVLATINHDPNQAVARTKNSSLSLSTDDYGLKYRFEVPNTTAGNDLYEMVRNGFYSESSFVYTVTEAGEQWQKRGADTLHIVNEVSGLYDISVVTDGAFANTDITVSERVLKRAMSMDDDNSNSTGSTGSTVIVAVDVAVVPDNDPQPEEQPTTVLVAEDAEGVELTILKLKLC